MKIGIVGYGTGGRHFHAPFILAAKNVELSGIVARADITRAKVSADLPDTPIYNSLTEMIASGVDAVTISTPPHTRHDLVLESINAGIHVIADKPFAPNAAEARALAIAAKDNGVTLGVYHNRRWDSDVQTLKSVIAGGTLGELWRLHSRMDLDDPSTIEAGPTGGLLRDLGTHLVDQAIYLLGPVLSVDAQLNNVQLNAGRTDASFALTLRHENGATSHISASKMNYVNRRELRLYGSGGSYITQSTDVQAQDIFAGKRPTDDRLGWGYEPQSHWGSLNTANGSTVIPAKQGAYFEYYEAFERAVRTGAKPPVTALDGVATLAVLDAARQSGKTGQVTMVNQEISKF
ncbi:Gfo/Idh/MocA family protein [Yoonia maritima]|uniref:Gfo/Idh/MocA family protein n=1 Tax=Yoonia maritima TaxID=1435347 RepID=UPI000D0FF0B1|nr:Gfo/Idh/MocA family oxidoreductase [Yoonia maritima]